MSIQKILISFIVFGLTVFVREFDSAFWSRDTGGDEEVKQSNGTVTSVALELNSTGTIQASSKLNISFDSDLLRTGSEIQVEEPPVMDFLLMLSDPNQLNSFLRAENSSDLLRNGTLKETPILTMDSNQTFSSSFSVNITKLRSLIEQQPNVSNTLIAALNKTKERQSNGVEEYQRVRRDVNASRDNISDDHEAHFNQSSPEQYRPELNQQNLTKEREQFSDPQVREEESQMESTGGFEEVVKPAETLKDDTPSIRQVETILNQLDEIRDMCIEVLIDSMSSSYGILIDELKQVRVICTVILEETDKMIPIEMENDDEEQRLQTQPASRGRRSVVISTVTPHRI